MRGPRARPEITLLYTLIILCSKSGLAPAQARRSAGSREQLVIRASQLRSDLDALEYILESTHASLDRYQSVSILKGRFDRARQLIARDSPSDIEFYGTITGLLSSIRDGHTQSVATPDLMRKARGEALRFPLDLRFTDGHAFVVGSPSRQVPLGCDVARINDVPMRLIRDTIIAHLAGDADIVAGKLANLSQNFPVLYYLFIGRPDGFDVACRAHDTSRLIYARVAAMTKTAAQAAGTRVPGLVERSGPDAAVHLERLDLPRAAWLVLGTFAYGPDSARGYPAYDVLLDSAFKQIRKDSVTDLVIDIRGNDGGDDFGPLIFSHIALEPFRFVDSITARTNDLTKLAPFSKLDSSLVRSFAVDFHEVGPNVYRLTRSDADLELRVPLKDGYNGCVWMLTDGETFSAASEFASIVRRTRRGLFVGEETGGAYHGNSAGEFAVVTLPSTKFRVVVPLERYVLAVGDKRDSRRGVRPDFRVVPTATSVLRGRDDALATTLRLISRSRTHDVASAQRACLN